MLLGWRAPRSPAQRGHRFLQISAQSNEHAPRLYVGFTKQVGRGIHGRRTVLSKGAAHSRNVFRKTVSSPAGLYSLGVVVRLEPVRHHMAAVALIRTAVGCWFHLPAPATITPLDYFAAAPSKKLAQLTSGLPATWLWQLAQFPPHTRLCSVTPPQRHSAQYARSAGSSCLLISTGLWGGWALVILPSGQAKLLEEASWAFGGTLAPGFKRYLGLAKSSKRLMRGFCPRVRGTAKNPNDHPHGGRTRAIKYPRTPWGKTAKKSRRPNPRLALKPLPKRRLKHRTYAAPLQLDGAAAGTPTAPQELHE